MLNFSDIQPIRDDTPSIKVVGVGGGGGDSGTPRYESYPLQIHNVSYDTCDANMARIVVGPEYDKWT